MARIPDSRKRKHQNISPISDTEATAILEGKGSQGQNGHLVQKTLGTTWQVSVAGNSSRDIADHLASAQQNGAGFEQKCVPSEPPRLQQTKEHEKDGIARKRKLSSSFSTSHLDINQAGLEQLQKLRSTIEQLGGKLEDGWQVNSQRRSNNGIPFFNFISPAKEKFRSRIDVVRHLGLPARPAKNRLLSKNQLALVPYSRRKKFRLSKARQISGKPSESGNNHEQAAKDARSVQQTSTRSLSASAITQCCQDILRSIISTESFAALSNMLGQGASSLPTDATLQLNGSSFPACPLDFKLIHLRLSSGAYGQDPEMFQTDIQQVWKNIITAGKVIVSLANSLAELSENLYKQEITRMLDGLAKKNVSISNEQSLDSTFVHMPLPERIIARAEETFSEELPDIFVEDHCGVKTSPLALRVAHSRFVKHLLSKTEAKRTSHQLNSKECKGAGKAKELFASQGGLPSSSVDEVCRKCGRKEGAHFIVCSDCQSSYHPDCTMATSKGGRWCCPLCLLSQATEKVWGNVGNGFVDEEAQKLFVINSDASTEICHGFQVSTGKTGMCEVCRKEDENVLLCDRCDAAYHMHCLSPAIDGVPDGSWYCPACTKTGEKSMVSKQDTNVHSCAVCERVSRELLNCAENESTAQAISKDDTSPLYLAPERSKDEHGYPERSLNQGFSAEQCTETRVIDPDLVAGNSFACKVCGQGEGKKTILCSNCRTCYHWSCLNPALRKWPRKTWYCPSCLCRVCKIDVDDDKILLCDGCDEGYHTYCLRPPLSEIPEEAWYCHVCMEANTEISNRPKKKQKSSEPSGPR